MTNSPFRIRAGVKGKREDGNSSVLLLLTLYSCFIVCSWLFPFAKKKKKNTEKGTNFGKKINVRNWKIITTNTLCSAYSVPDTLLRILHLLMYLYL